MEFKITSDLAVVQGQQITANFEEVSAWLDEELAPYTSMVVTADAIPAAKTYRANIRKVKERIEQYRKEAKNAALAPYNAFEQKCKVLTGKLDEAAGNLDRQVKDFENREKAEKIEALCAEWVALADGETENYCTWELIFNEKWGNKGFAFDDAVEEIKAAMNTTKVNIGSIREIGGEDTAYLLDCYKTTHDFNAVIRKSLEIKAAREREEQRRREAEEARRRAAEAEEQRRREAEAAKSVAEQPQETSFAEEAPAPVYAPAVTTEIEQDELVTIDFRVTCTKTQLNALGQYMKRTGIKYGRVV